MNLQMFYGDIVDDAEDQGILRDQVGVMDIDLPWDQNIIAVCGSKNDPDSEVMARRIKAVLEITEPLSLSELEMQAENHLKIDSTVYYSGDVRLGDGTQGILRNRIGLLDKTKPFKSCIIAICGSATSFESQQMTRRIDAALAYYSSFSLEELERRAEEALALRVNKAHTTSGYMPCD